jgi:hypothetical protein
LIASTCSFFLGLRCPPLPIRFVDTYPDTRPTRPSSTASMPAGMRSGGGGQSACERRSVVGSSELGPPGPEPSASKSYTNASRRGRNISRTAAAHCRAAAWLNSAAYSARPAAVTNDAGAPARPGASAAAAADAATPPPLPSPPWCCALCCCCFCCLSRSCGRVVRARAGPQARRQHLACRRRTPAPFPPGAAPTPPLPAHLLQQRVVQALDQVRVRHVAAQKLRIRDRQPAERLGADAARRELRLCVLKVRVGALAALARAVPVVEEWGAGVGGGV